MQQNINILCWICKINPADSREHIYKKDILKENAFNSNNRNDKPYLFNFSNNAGSIQGPDSKKVKYGYIICSVCNNEYSQPWDKAYSEFINFFKNSCLAYVDFEQIFGIDYIENFMNLYKYFIKSLGCRLVSGGLELSSEFSNLLSSPNLLSSSHFKNFRVTICRCDSA